MTDRCSAAGPRNASFDDRSCEPTPEAHEANAAERAREAEREAEARRNAYYAGGTDEGGRCARASSDATPYAPMLRDDPHLEDSQRTAAVDRPLETDRYGNALIGAIAGGAVAGVRVAAAEALAPSAGTAHVVQHIAVATANSATKAVAATAARSTLHVGSEVPAPPPADQGASTGGPAGRSGARGVSEPAPEPNQSVAPVRIPFVVQG